jgi:cell division protease FtsH
MAETDDKPDGAPKLKMTLFWLVYVLLPVALLFSIYRVFPGSTTPEVSYNEFLAELRAGHLAEVEITETQLIGKLKPEAVDQKTGRQTLTASRLPKLEETALIRELDEQKVKYSGSISSGSSWGMVLSMLLPLLLLLMLLSVISRQSMQGVGGALSFGRNRAKIYDQSSRNRVNFTDVAGVDEAVAELTEVVDFLRNPQKYQELGGRIPKGVLLVGPPGTGKTLLARAVAGEAAVAFFSISGSEFVEMFVGVGAARVRDLFEQARQKAPCIIFIDELDAIGKSRSAGRGMIMSHDEREQTLNQLLAEMDGFDTSKGVIIMAATNTPEVLDPALLRAGRFDRQVVIDRPDLKGREEILKVHARGVKLGPDVELKTIAARTPGMVGADLANLVNEGALLAARRGAFAVAMHDLEEAIDRVMLGLEKKSRVMSHAEKERVACHETGHALVALSVRHADPVHRVSIIPRSIGVLGHTLQLPTQEKFLMTQPEIEDQLAVMLGGRAAEEITYHGVISTGAANDLERASELARQMVTRFGLSERLGHQTWGLPLSARFLPSTFTGEERNYSERTAELIDEETRRIIDETYNRVRKLLMNRRDELARIASELMQRETLEREELEKLLNPAAHTAADPVMAAASTASNAA